MPGMIHSGLFCSHSQAQKAKHPPISPGGASKYHGSEVNLKSITLEL